MQLLTFAFFCFILGSFSVANAANPFILYSSAFSNNGAIPLINTCKTDEGNRSPAFNWVNAPKGTKSYAITCVDIDAPGGNFIHWVIYNLPTNTNILSDGVEKLETLPNGAKQGINSFRRIGYDGPCPPPGKTHRYIFTLYALDSALDLPPRATYADFQKAAKGHVLSQTQLTGLFNSDAGYSEASLDSAKIP